MSSTNPRPEIAVDQIYKRLYVIAEERLSITPERLATITGSSEVVEGLQLDSLAQVTFLSAIEDEFGIELEMEDREQMRTLEDLAGVIGKRLASTSCH